MSKTSKTFENVQPLEFSAFCGRMLGKKIPSKGTWGYPAEQLSRCEYFPRYTRTLKADEDGDLVAGLSGY
ncbi:hypothetical protein RUM43_000350 [Polyplax serrata]|uniref:Uncharacterized protein n=1 Tax=Polyplax serrata TaxID=468196 RepID=A0AAN8SCE4_POLSC